MTVEYEPVAFRYVTFPVTLEGVRYNFDGFDLYLACDDKSCDDYLCKRPDHWSTEAAS